MPNKSFRIILGYLLATIIGLYVVYSGEQDILIQKAIYFLGPLTSVFAGVYTLYEIGWKGRRARALLYSVIALWFWLFGEIVSYYNAWHSISQYPSMEDVCYWIGYIAFAVAIINESRLYSVHFSQLSTKVKVILGGLLLSVYAVVGYIGVTIGYKPTETWVVNASTISWSIGDLIIGTLSIGLLAMSWKYRNGTVKTAWLWFISAMSINLIADTIYNISPSATTTGSPTSLLLNAMWTTAYILIAGYFLEVLSDIKQLISKIS